MRAVPRWGWVALLTVVADLVSKQWAVNALVDRDIDLVWTLRLNLSFNTGMAFGQGQAFGPIIAAIAMIVIVVLVTTKRPSGGGLDVATGLIVGGAIGNLIDRLFRSPGWFRGAVVDFIDFQWFPIFNIADMGITIGGALLVLGTWWISRHDQTELPT
ncbi:MAG: signal peptidase II [Ilumatobacter coccineus]|uniref:Lipoprotein signal peptidase n=1 Tax=Ilumatobacter coccineus TaxID=467094 RepID=A0A2G6K6B9_9ACTN|nr:MAG: signal peptidase II [Ilumatobacter coccineus]